MVITVSIRGEGLLGWFPSLAHTEQSVVEVGVSYLRVAARQFCHELGYAISRKQISFEKRLHQTKTAGIYLEGLVRKLQAKNGELESMISSLQAGMEKLGHLCRSPESDHLPFIFEEQKAPEDE